MPDMVPDYILGKKTGIHGMIHETHNVYKIGNRTISSLFHDFEICSEVCQDVNI